MTSFAARILLAAVCVMPFVGGGTAEAQVVSCGTAYTRLEAVFARRALRLAAVLCAAPDTFGARTAILVEESNRSVGRFNALYAGAACDPDVPRPVPDKTSADVMLVLQAAVRSIPLDRFCNGLDDPESPCGNDQEDPGETCDGTDLGGQSCESLGQGTGTLGCAFDCQSFDLDGCTGAAYCGNGRVDPEHGEACDAGGQTATCDVDCSSAQCGDGLLNALAGEQCDLGFQNSGAADAPCRPNCQSRRCGDGIADFGSGERCDLGASNSSAPNAACRTNCQPRRCGDSVLDNASGEVCDDGNNTSGDNCSADCRSAEVCGNGVVDVVRGELCDAGGSNSNAPNAPCRPDCQPTRCGDGVADPARGEACDLGGANSNLPNASCRTSCQRQRCGDGVLDNLKGEVCDDGNNVSGDSCSADCLSN